LGIWGSDNNPWLVTDTSKKLQGFYIVTAKVKALSSTRYGLRFELQGGAVVFADASLFTDQDANKLVNKTIEVRGWFHHSKGQSTLKLHHLSNLDVKD